MHDSKGTEQVFQTLTVLTKDLFEVLQQEQRRGRVLNSAAISTPQFMVLGCDVDLEASQFLKIIS